MIKRHCLFLLLAGLLWPALPGAAAAQEGLDEQRRSQSHLPIPSSVSNPDEAQLLLAQRLHHAQGMAGLQKLLEDPKFREMAMDIASNPEKYNLGKQVEKLKQDLMDPSKAARPDLDDPAWRDVIGKVLEEGPARNSALTITPEQQSAWRDVLERFPQESRPGLGPGGMSRSPEGMPPQPGSIPPPPPGNAGPQPPGANDRPPTPPGSPPAPDPALDARARFSKQLYDLAERLQKADPALQKSPALSEFMKKLSRYAAPGNRPSSQLPDSAKLLTERLPRLGDYLDLDRLRRDAERWRPESPILPAAPHFPGIRPGGPITLPAAGMPRPGAERVNVSGWPLLLWAVIGLGFGFALWRVLAWQQERTTRTPDSGWRLGPWPVNPAAVTTREDLVRAFDYLALLCLGPVARSWNHLEIAARLGDDAPRSARRASAEERRGAAARLAVLYEQARYAPPAEALPDAELAAARRHLCLLAGVPAA
jgi:hypothetical protein